MDDHRNSGGVSEKPRVLEGIAVYNDQVGELPDLEGRLQMQRLAQAWLNHDRDAAFVRALRSLLEADAV